ncbi:amidoligase family protein [Marinobacterium sediminicola]|uniref:Amidoligase enzyme n=1 Tax=Marinobacterium sediminicola TaxID=518898 RepID=A0ABY1RW18_9GAMM|nr:amidoligase family protein [Marinobacterium sediminicola]ULG70512.1 amidoligase family protein [Marinobacterium sediminicola]SMR69129.1 Putative amidoligase enzyme [Marinobacterium sediminicola]
MSRYLKPAQQARADGTLRRVGFELEFTGLTFAQAREHVRQALKGAEKPKSPVETSFETDAGVFNLELDWALLKQVSKEYANADPTPDWLESLSRAAAIIVPIELVCPPIPLDQLASLDPIINTLRVAGAQGTDDSIIAALGVHINAELPDTKPSTIQAYLKAYSLLQWWLVDAHDVNIARKVSPYVDLYPEEYIDRLLVQSDANLDDIFDLYLTYNATRNRALDLLPLLSHLDEQRVQEKVQDDRIKARPAFHYRLPNCEIENKTWSLDAEWNTWWVVEQLSADSSAIETLSRRWSSMSRPLLGVNRDEWVSGVDQWLHERGWL